MSPQWTNSIQKYPACQRHGSIPIESNVIILYMMQYVMSINKAIMPANCHWFWKNLRIQNETNHFSEPRTLSIVLYTIYKNINACRKYFYICNIALNQTHFIPILYNETKHKLIKWLMEKCTSWQWVKISTCGSN